MSTIVIQGDQPCRHGTPFCRPCVSCADEFRNAKQVAKDAQEASIRRLAEYRRDRPYWYDDGLEVYADDDFIMECVEYARKRGMI